MLRGDIYGFYNGLDRRFQLQQKQARIRNDALVASNDFGRKGSVGARRDANTVFAGIADKNHRYAGGRAIDNLNQGCIDTFRLINIGCGFAKVIIADSRQKTHVAICAPCGDSLIGTFSASEGLEIVTHYSLAG
jgi:hypothetical protein